jgi:transposase InsO family protein
MHTHPAPLHPVISVGPFAKWGIDFTTCKPPSAAGRHYIIMAMDYFTKWEEAMSTYTNNAKTTTLFLFNHIIARFGIPKSIVTYHGTHFCNAMMVKLTSMLYLDHKHSSPYYPLANGQVKSINCVLKTMLQWMVGKHKSNWHVQLFSTLWAYRTSEKIAIGFTPFQLVYGLEAVLLIECEIPSLRLTLELLPHTTNEEHLLLYLSHLDEIRRDATLANETHQKCIKKIYDRVVQPRTFLEGDLVLVYDQDKDALGVGKFEPLWYGPYIISKVLQKGAYELVDYEGNKLARPRNGLYLKQYVT